MTEIENIEKIIIRELEDSSYRLIFKMKILLKNRKHRKWIGEIKSGRKFPQNRKT